MTPNDAQAVASGAIDAAAELVLAGKHMDAERLLDGAIDVLLAAWRTDPGTILLDIGRLSGASAAFVLVRGVADPARRREDSITRSELARGREIGSSYRTRVA